MPRQNAEVPENQASVAHSAAPRRAEGVVSLYAKLTPVMVNCLLVSVYATFATAASVLTTGAGDRRGKVGGGAFSGRGRTGSRVPSKVKPMHRVPTKPAVTVTTTLRSSGVPVTSWKHATLVPDVHAVVAHAPSALCPVGVLLTVLKLRPATVRLCATENARLGPVAWLSTGAVAIAERVTLGI